MSTLQNPINSGFTVTSTAVDVIRGIDLSGKLAVVTGGYSGIGVETVRTLRSAGAEVIVPARDTEKAKRALAGIGGVEVAAMDLMNPDTIDSFAGEIAASGRPLHILVNSAGIMGAPLVRNAQGYESHFQTNHLGHFQLVAKLWPALRRANGARVVALSSFGHTRAQVSFDDPNFVNREYDRTAAYGQSKTANVLFAVALDERGKGEGVRAFSVWPGRIAGTGLERNFSFDDLRGFGVVDEDGRPIVDPAKQMKTVEQGAATSVWCATSAQLDGLGGLYCENCDIARLRLDEEDGGVMPYAVDPDAAERLWDLSERLTGSNLQ